MEKTDQVTDLGFGILLGDIPGLMYHPTAWPQLVHDSFCRTSAENKPEVSSPAWSAGLQTCFTQT